MSFGGIEGHCHWKKKLKIKLVIRYKNPEAARRSVGRGGKNLTLKLLVPTQSLVAFTSVVPFLLRRGFT